MHESRVKKNIDSLDGLRAFACLLVVFGHLAKEEIIVDIKGSGQLGVMLFFVLSGFLMAHLYGCEKISVSRFVEYGLRRSFRVVPAYVVALLLSFWISPYWPEFPYNMDMSGLVKHLKLQGDTSVFWTIPVELKFYAFFPVIWLLLGFLKNTVLRAAIIFVAFIVSVNIFPFGERLDLSRYLEFFIGGVCAGYVNSQMTVTSPWKRETINVTFIATVILTLVFIPQVFLHLTGIIHGMWRIPQILASLFALCVLLCANTTGWARKIFSNNILMFLGKISFSLYLVHYPFIYFINHWAVLNPVAWFIKVILSLTLALAFACLFYVMVEKPFRQWGAELNHVLQKRFA